MIVITNCSGFFSNFLKVLHWMICNTENEKIVPYFIDKGFNIICGNHFVDKNIYIDKENIWEIMFNPINNYTIDELNSKDNFFTFAFPEIKNNHPYPINLYRNGYFYMDVNVYYKDYFHEIRKIFYNQFKKIEFTDYLNNILDNKNPIKNPDKTLAIMIRCPQHYRNVSSNYFDLIIDEVTLLMKDYDYLFVVSNIKEYNNKLQEIFKEKFIMYNNKIQINKNIDWGIESWDYKKESIDVFCEVYWASKCALICGGSSNMLLGALFINPNNKFKIFDVLKNVNGN